MIENIKNIYHHWKLDSDNFTHVYYINLVETINTLYIQVLKTTTL